MSSPHSSSGPRPRFDLSPLLRPRSIAVVGASEKPGTGRSLVESIRSIGFQGTVYPINPGYEELLGHKCYPSLEATPEPADVAAFCVRTSRIKDGMESAARAGVRGAVIFDAGFAEQGAEGKQLQADITAICNQAKIALCGPNGMGVLNPHERSTVYLSQVKDPSALAGNVGLISQSGSVCIAMLTDVRRFGYSHVISSGNEAGLTAADYVDALVDDEKTKVIACFLEAVRDPEGFVRALDRAADAGKPVVVLKVGQSDRAQRAIVSHTGGLAGSGRVFSELLRAHRAIEVREMEEFIEVIAACQHPIRPKGSRTAVVTASGGQAELIVDIASFNNYDLPPLPAEDRPAIEQVIGQIVGDGNPLDAWGNADYATNLPHALKTLQASKANDNIVVATDSADNQPLDRPDPLYNVRLVANNCQQSDKPHFILATRGGSMATGHIKFLQENRIVYLSGIRQGLFAVDRLGRWASPQPAKRAEKPLGSKGVATALAAAPGRKTINEFDSKAILAAAGLPVTREGLAKDLAEAQRLAKEIGYPVVLKAVSDDIAHKSDLGLVKVGIRDEKALEAAWQALQKNIDAAASHGKVSAVLVQEMIVEGVEVFAGVNRDPTYGLVLAFGLGGVMIDVLDDVALRMLPLRAGEAAEMISSIRGGKILGGVRGAPPADVKALAACLEALADYAWADRDQIAEIDLNPIKVLPEGQGCRIVDALIVPKS